MKTFPVAFLQKFSKKNLQNKICLSPYVVLDVGVGGEIGLCDCRAWLPSRVGNLFKENIQDILANEKSVAIRQSISDGTYEYCNEQRCGVLGNNQLIDHDSIQDPVFRNLINNPYVFIMPREIWISGDLTCNLSCPSCRTKVIKNTPEEVDKLEALGQIIKNNLFSKPSNESVTLHISSSGEVFASPMLLSFLGAINPNDFPELRLRLQTNGLLAEKNWYRLGVLEQRVEKITVSVDAAQKHTYEKLRRGGKWEDLQHALAWIQQKKNNNQMEISLRMVVQQANYQEIVEFYNLAKTFGADIVEYARITDWKSYSEHEFRQVDAFDPNHQEYQLAQAELDKVKHLDGVFLHGGLA